VSGNSGACRGKLAVCSGKCGFITQAESWSRGGRTVTADAGARLRAERAGGGKPREAAEGLSDPAKVGGADSE
jgi:hypothetical protein